MSKKGLGRGLDALLADNERESQSGVSVLRLSDIEPNPSQARKNFDLASLEELASSISLHGLIQPVIVRKKENGFYEIIAGERRWRASKMAGLTEIPVIVRDYDDETASVLSLIENLQREDLNPVEEAKGYKELTDRYGMTQEDAARQVGKSRAAVANMLRLLSLPQTVLSLVSDGSLSYGHARAMIPLMEKQSADELLKTARSVAESGISVRETEKLVKNILSSSSQKQPENPSEKAYYVSLEKKISGMLGRRTVIKKSSGGGGQLVLKYASGDDLEQLIKSLCGKDFFEDNE